MRASEMATELGFGPDKIYWTATPLSVLAAAWPRFAESTDNPSGREGHRGSAVRHSDDQIAACIDGHEQHERKVAAMRAHGSQIPSTSWLYSIAGNFGAEFMGVEHFTLAYGRRGRARPARLGKGPLCRA